jgi:hypothetical protein
MTAKEMLTSIGILEKDSKNSSHGMKLSKINTKHINLKLLRKRASLLSLKIPLTKT